MLPPRAIGLLSFGLALCGPLRAAQAQPQTEATSPERSLPASASVALPDCPEAPVSWDELLEQLGVELGEMGVELERHGTSEPTDARIAFEVPECDAEADAMRVTITSRATGRSAGSHISVPPPERSERLRVLALAVAELLRARWPALTTDVDGRLAELERWRRAHAEAHTRSESARDERAAELEGQLERTREALAATRDRLASTRQRLEHVARTREPTARAPETLVGAQLAVWSYPGSSAGFVGPRVSVDVPVGPLRLVADADAGFGTERTELGDVRVRSVRGGLALLAGYRPGFVSFSAGPALRAGWARAQGTPFDPDAVEGDTVDGGLAVVGGRAVVHVPLVRRLRVGVELEAGYGLGGVDARIVDPRIGDRRVTALEGAYLGLGVGLSIATGDEASP